MPPLSSAARKKAPRGGRYRNAPPRASPAPAAFSAAPPAGHQPNTANEHLVRVRRKGRHALDAADDDAIFLVSNDLEQWAVVQGQAGIEQRIDERMRQSQVVVAHVPPVVFDVLLAACVTLAEVVPD